MGAAPAASMLDATGPPGGDGAGDLAAQFAAELRALLDRHRQEFDALTQRYGTGR
jgi:hypothetical protein